MGFSLFLAITQVMYITVSGWSHESALEEEINRKIKTLDQSIDHDHEKLEIKDIQFLYTGRHAWVVYDIVEKAS